MENRTAGIIQETRKKIKKKPSLQNPEIQADLEIQLKASRDVRCLLCIICIGCRFNYTQQFTTTGCNGNGCKGKASS